MMIRRLASACVLALLLAACGGGDDGTATAPAVEDGTVEVTAVDYAFEGLPDTVPVGTQFTLHNASDMEAHELVLVKIPDGEGRALGELLQLPEEELGGMMMPGLVGVSVAAPGEDGQVVEGNLTVTEPGRYAAVCFIPTGADPEEFLAAAEESDGPPDVEGGPPHVANGMFAELTVLE